MALINMVIDAGSEKERYDLRLIMHRPLLIEIH